MATLTEHTMLNGLEENLKSAIEYAGGTIPDNTCVWMYPDIIRTQLTGPGEGGKVNLVPGTGIEITQDEKGNVVISAKSSSAENIIVDAIDAPEYSGISTWPEGTILQNLLEDLFYKVIPKIPSIVKGDVIITDETGKDQYAPELESYVDSLRPNTTYLRIFLVSQKDPIYISLEKVVGAGGPVDLSDYYTKSQTDKLIEDSVKTIEIQPDPDKEPVTVVEVVEKVIQQESQIQQVEQTVQNQNDQITHVTEQINNMDQTIIQTVQNESATEEDAIKSFESIFENN